MGGFIKDFKTPGRPLKINSQRVDPAEGKNYSDIMFFGDLHLGHPNCLVDLAKENLKKCLEENIRVIVMGDLIECGTRNSVGDSVYSQTMNPQDQMDQVIELLKPLADKGLILGILEGNHENRITKESGFNVSRIISNTLGVPYLFQAKWNYFQIGKQSYSVYTIHGVSGAKTPDSKLKIARDISKNFQCDVFAHAHVHDVLSDTSREQKIDKKNRILELNKKIIIITGHYLGYEGSYAQAMGLSIGKIGSPIIRFFSEEHDMKVFYEEPR